MRQTGVEPAASRAEAPPKQDMGYATRELASSVSTGTSAAAFTIVARNYAAHARTLMASFAAADPAVDRFVFVIDAIEEVPEVHDARVLVSADVFDFESYASLAYSFDVTELSTCVKPFVMRHLLARGYDRAFYFDPDIEVFTPIDVVRDPLDEADIVLTPHATDPIPLDGKLPDEITLLQAGAYNLGFIGVANRPAARRFLDWWSERLVRYCVSDVESGLFTDQKWIDLVPGMVERVAIVRDRGCNVAYWNLHARRIDPKDPSRLASGEPVVFYHYSGFDPRTPAVISKHQTRTDLAHEPGLAFLLKRYAERLMANGFEQASTAPYRYARFSNGVPLDTFSRSVLREARLQGRRFPDPGDVFAEPSAWRYLNERFEEDMQPSAVPLTRYLYEVWRKRADLRAVFPRVLSTDRERYFTWLRNDAAAPIHRAYLAEGGLRANNRASLRGASGVTVAGYFRTESGVGEAGRAHVLALNTAGIPTRLLDFSAHAPSRDRDETVAARDADGDHRINLVCVNADQVPTFVEETGPDFFAGRYNIGSWWWELPSFPEAWTGAFRHFDEIWAGTQFIASAIAAKSPIPVVLIPPVVSVGSVRAGRKRAFGLSDEETVFLFVFDFLSVFARKNPLGAIAAFRRAFPDPAEPVRLVLKSVNGDFDPANRERLLAAVGDDPRVTLMNDYLTRAQKNELIAACDAYVSLHRSEGFGYTLAEAMAMGKPLIGTDWSGPADFMTASNSFPVRYELVELTDDFGPYSAGQVWAEPDLEDAARAMRAVRERPAEAALRGERARADIAVRYSPVAIAKLVGERIARIGDRLDAAVLA
jgi:glycosyltransferase involved in cell wall biosynthesis